MIVHPTYLILNVCYRISRRRFCVKKSVLRNFAKFTGKHLCQCLFFKKVAGLRPATLLKRKLRHRCFPVTFAKFLIRSFYRTLPNDCLWSCNRLPAILESKWAFKCAYFDTQTERTLVTLRFQHNDTCT